MIKGKYSFDDWSNKYNAETDITKRLNDELKNFIPKFLFLLPLSNTDKNTKKLNTLPNEIANPQLLAPISGERAICFA